MIGYGLLVVIPAFAFLRVFKVIENGLNYSLQNTARHALILPCDEEQKYAGKTTIDTLFWRLGGMMAIRKGDWKLVALSGKPWELYDLSCDPAEMHDLAAREPARQPFLGFFRNAGETRDGADDLLFNHLLLPVLWESTR